MSINLRHGTVAAALVATTALGTVVAAQEAKTIQIATHYNEEQMAPLLACFDAYEASHPGITIEFQQAAYGDFLQTILTSRVGGTSPSCFSSSSRQVARIFFALVR